MKKQYLFLSLILLFLSIGAFQPFGCNTTISGIVTESGGSTIEGAVVSIADEFDTFTSSTTTNSIGEYTFEDVPYNDYIISVSSTGYITKSSETITTSYFETGITCKDIDGVNIPLVKEEEMEPHELPDTGQEESYTTTFGEDHDYQPTASQPSYTDNGDGTITDNRTGLMWVKDGNSAGCVNGSSVTWESALTFCEGLSYANYTEWRLPNRRELESIVDAGEDSPAINTTYFPNTASIYYWTSTTYVSTPSEAWGVSFGYGGVDGSSKTDNMYVRPVRGGPAKVLPDTGQEQSYTSTFGEDHDYQPAESQPSYTDNGDGTITDNRTGLMWVKDRNSAGCNDGNTLKWEEVLTFCEGLSYANYTEWRLPNRRELESIIDAGEDFPAINTTYFPNTSSFLYWTSTTYVSIPSFTWGVNFIYGSMSSVNKTGDGYVRPVRGGP